MRDVLAELRPQARRLAAQAEQLVARRSAGLDLAEALLAVAHARWHELNTVAKAEQAAWPPPTPKPMARSPTCARRRTRHSAFRGLWPTAPRKRRRNARWLTPSAAGPLNCD